MCERERDREATPTTDRQTVSCGQQQQQHQQQQHRAVELKLKLLKMIGAILSDDRGQTNTKEVCEEQKGKDCDDHTCFTRRSNLYQLILK